MQKTNVMRILDSAKIDYNTYEYPSKVAIDAVTVARIIGKDVEEVYKTLVTVGKSGENYVFVVPSMKELSLKAGASSSGEKSIDMIEVKKITPLTGYVKGGCSPIGMKKQFKTFIDSSAQNRQTIIVSAGKIGLQVEINPHTLADLIGATFSEIAH